MGDTMYYIPADEMFYAPTVTADGSVTDEPLTDNYAAAGIIPYRTRIARSGLMVVDILLCVEKRFEGQPPYDVTAVKKPVFHVLCGKRESTDVSAFETATREFWEETGRCLTDSDWNPLVVETANCCWTGRSRAKLFVCEYDKLFPHRFDIVSSHAKSHDREIDSLKWICLDSLLYACRNNTPLFDIPIGQFLRSICSDKRNLDLLAQRPIDERSFH